MHGFWLNQYEGVDMVNLSRKLEKCYWYGVVSIAGIASSVCMATGGAGAGAGVAGAGAGASDSGSIGGIAHTIRNSMADIGSLILSVGFVAGLAFVVAAVFKFKSHRDNPQQVPVGQPFAMLAVGISLVFLPSIIGAGGVTLFGAGKATQAGYEGVFS